MEQNFSQTAEMRFAEADEVDEGFGWQKDIDENGNECIYPDLSSAAEILRMLSEGKIPELDWKSPGRINQFHSTDNQPHNSIASSSSSSPSKETQGSGAVVASSAQNHSGNMNTQMDKNFFNLSPFDFDDSDFADTKFDPLPLDISPIKSEPRKRVVGTLNHAMQLAGHADPSPVRSHNPAKNYQPTNAVMNPTAESSIYQSHHQDAATFSSQSNAPPDHHRQSSSSGGADDSLAGVSMISSDGDNLDSYGITDDVTPIDVAELERHLGEEDLTGTGSGGDGGATGRSSD